MQRNSTTPPWIAVSNSSLSPQKQKQGTDRDAGKSRPTENAHRRCTLSFCKNFNTHWESKLRGDLDISGLLNSSSPFLAIVVSRTSNLPSPCTPCDKGAVGELASLRPSPLLGQDNLPRPTAQLGTGSPQTRSAALCCSSCACATQLASWELARKARPVSLTPLGPVSPPSLGKILDLALPLCPCTTRRLISATSCCR